MLKRAVRCRTTGLLDIYSTVGDRAAEPVQYAPTGDAQSAPQAMLAAVGCHGRR